MRNLVILKFSMPHMGCFKCGIWHQIFLFKQADCIWRSLCAECGIGGPPITHPIHVETNKYRLTHTRTLTQTLKHTLRHCNRPHIQTQNHAQSELHQQVGSGSKVVYIAKSFFPQRCLHSLTNHMKTISFSHSTLIFYLCLKFFFASINLIIYVNVIRICSVSRIKNQVDNFQINGEYSDGKSALFNQNFSQTCIYLFFSFYSK